METECFIGFIKMSQLWVLINHLIITQITKKTTVHMKDIFGKKSKASLMRGVEGEVNSSYLRFSAQVSGGWQITEHRQKGHRTLYSFHNYVSSSHYEKENQKAAMWGFQPETKAVPIHEDYLVGQSGTFLGLKVPCLPSWPVLRKWKSCVRPLRSLALCPKFSCN